MKIPKDMYFVYVLKSLKDRKFYTGYTGNINSRLKLHNSGKVRSTQRRRPLKLIGYKEFKSRKEARWVEYNLKHHSDKKEKFLKEIINKKKGYKPEGNERLLTSVRKAAGPEGLWPGGR